MITCANGHPQVVKVPFCGLCGAPFQSDKPDALDSAHKASSRPSPASREPRPAARRGGWKVWTVAGVIVVIGIAVVLVITGGKSDTYVKGYDAGVNFGRHGQNYDGPGQGWSLGACQGLAGHYLERYSDDYYEYIQGCLDGWEKEYWARN